eukprot:CAMPEP_0114321802 /NCGR_PEP_ID=MMETSP0059-20121206/26820_1 /TAXON_ID=36894 /ORGANISM="Pyramimonas parkeae, Strain CCMP726" /LENGTH=875 /DNA_ID=CAMNT_0001449603 /DNA_START=163 /DNA_END=2791 /DNA_ORIENTATION=-
MDTCTLYMMKWVFAFSLSVIIRASLASSQSLTKCLGPDFSASCAIADGREGVESITGRALPEEAGEGVYHIKDIKFTVSNTPCFNYSAGCSYGGLTSDTAESVGCIVDEAGTWEACDVVYCSDLPLCDAELQAIADDASVPKKVQVYTPREYVNALMNNRVEEIMIMERIYVSEAVLPPVPIIIRRRVHVKPAANAIHLKMNLTMWSQILVTRLGFFRCTSCSIIVYGADWGASLAISHPYTPLPHTAFERGGVVNMDQVHLLTDCFALDQAGEMLIPRLSMFEEPFTRGEQGEDHQGRAPLTQLGPPMPPEGRVPGDPPLGVLLYWIAADLIVNVGGGLLQSRAPRISCFEWVQEELWTESYRNRPPPPMASELRVPTHPLNSNSNSDTQTNNKNNEKSGGLAGLVWARVAGALVLGAACAWAAAKRRASMPAAEPRSQDSSVLLAHTQAMLRVYVSALSANPAPEEPSPQVEEGDLALTWSQMGEMLRLNQPVITVDTEVSSEGASVAPPFPDSGTVASNASGLCDVSSKNLPDIVSADQAAEAEGKPRVEEWEASEASAGTGATPGDQSSSAGHKDHPLRRFFLGPLNLASPQHQLVESGLNSYLVHEFVGSGAFAVCYRATNVETNQPFALKMAKFSKDNADLKLEAELLGSLHHPHIVTMIESFVHQNRQVLVLEWCAGGDMRAEVNMEALDNQFVWQAAAQLTLAVAHVHAQNMVHRDIKMENVFLTEHGNIKLGDFGVARVILDEATTFAGTPQCMAPEVLWNKPYTQKSDVWSMGALIYELITRMPLVDGRSIESIRRKHVSLEPKKTMRGPNGAELDMDLVQMVLSMLRKEPEHRPSPQQILSMPCMKQAIQSLIMKKSGSELLQV